MTTNLEFVAGLRQVADFYFEHPEVPLPDHRVTVFQCHTKEEAAAIVLALGDGCKQEFGGANRELFVVSKQMAGVELRFIFSRDKVCERVVVGQKTEDILEWKFPSLPDKA